MKDFRKLTLNEKALRINLDNSIYGSFSEIGAGQDVAGTFFEAGGSSGTIALSQSAYDMKISDSIYGESPRYVSEHRLKAMLKHDYDALAEKLSHKADDKSFFAFSNTIETLNFHKTNQGHGWLGCRFQLTTGGPVNECIMHIKLHDTDTLLQQKAVGRIGVNLIYACYYHHDNLDDFLESLYDSISINRIEIDMFNIQGDDFEEIDNRIVSLKLVKNGFTPAAMFGPDGTNIQASEVLYKKNIIVLRGRFRPPTLVNVDMLLSGYRQFKQEEDVNREKLMVLCELSLKNLMHKGENVDEKDFLDRVDILCSLGQTVMITNFQWYYQLATYLTNVNRGEKVGLILGVNNLAALFDPSYYKHLKGGILEAFGRLFGRNVKLLVYPATNGSGDGLFNTDNFEVSKKLDGLYRFILDNQKVEDIKQVNKELLTIYSDDVLDLIQSDQEGWEAMVPNRVAKAIKKYGMFNYIKKANKKKKEFS